MSVIAPFIRKHEKVFWQNMMDAIQRIAQGDFRVHLPVDRENRNHPFSKLATGINDMVAQLRVMEEMRQEFISNVSHEIGSPLTSIRGFARALKNENLSREQRMRYLDIIETECVRLSKLSENLLRLTMLESNQPPFFPPLIAWTHSFRPSFSAASRSGRKRSWTWAPTSKRSSSPPMRTC